VLIKCPLSKILKIFLQHYYKIILQIYILTTFVKALVLLKHCIAIRKITMFLQYSCEILCHMRRRKYETTRRIHSSRSLFATPLLISPKRVRHRLVLGTESAKTSGDLFFSTSTIHPSSFSLQHKKKKEEDKWSKRSSIEKNRPKDERARCERSNEREKKRDA
jgi:hypothetical protein